MIKVKEYPPVISVMTIVEDRLLGAKSYPTVKKRLKELNVRVLKYDMVRTDALFNALLSKKEEELPILRTRKSKPFKLPR